MCVFQWQNHGFLHFYGLFWFLEFNDVHSLELILIIMQIAHALILMGARDTFELRTICYTMIAILVYDCMRSLTHLVMWNGNFFFSLFLCCWRFLLKKVFVLERRNELGSRSFVTFHHKVVSALDISRNCFSINIQIDWNRMHKIDMKCSVIHAIYYYIRFIFSFGLGFSFQCLV